MRGERWCRGKWRVDGEGRRVSRKGGGEERVRGWELRKKNEWFGAL